MGKPDADRRWVDIPVKGSRKQAFTRPGRGVTPPFKYREVWGRGTVRPPHTKRSAGLSETTVEVEVFWHPQQEVIHINRPYPPPPEKCDKEHAEPKRLPAVERADHGRILASPSAENKPARGSPGRLCSSSGVCLTAASPTPLHVCPWDPRGSSAPPRPRASTHRSGSPPRQTSRPTRSEKSRRMLIGEP